MDKVVIPREIHSCLAKHKDEGITIGDLSYVTGVRRFVCLKSLSSLYDNGMVYTRVSDVGSSRKVVLWFPNDSVGDIDDSRASHARSSAGSREKSRNGARVDSYLLRKKEEEYYPDFASNQGVNRSIGSEKLDLTNQIDLKMDSRRRESNSDSIGMESEPSEPCGNGIGKDNSRTCPSHRDPIGHKGSTDPKRSKATDHSSLVTNQTGNKSIDLSGKSEKISPREKLSKSLKTKAKSKKRSIDPKRYLKTPSDHPILQTPTNIPPGKWRPINWVGYWLHRYKCYYGIEDPYFVGSVCHKTATESRKAGNGQHDRFWSAGMSIMKFRNSKWAFDGDGEAMKAYVDWVFDEFLPNNSWLDHPPSSRQIFNNDNNFFYQRYQTKDVGNPKSKKRQDRQGAEKWHHWGVTYDG